MNITYHNYRTVCLTAILTGLLLATSSETAYAHHKQAGVAIGGMARNGHDSHFDRGRGHDKSYHKHKDHRRSYYRPRVNKPTYYPRAYYGKRIDYPRYHRHGNDAAPILLTGLFIGALIGTELGRYMNDVDQMRAREANMRARSSPIGTQITWNNPQSSNAGSIIATRDGYSESGKYCREFYQTVIIGGRTEDAYGVACRQPDGSWHIVQPE